MPYEFKTVQTVEFADTDMAGIVHFANFFRYMEVTEHAFLRSLGLSVHVQEGRRTIGMPRVSAACDFRLPLRFEDQVEVHLRVREKKKKSLTYDFIFRKVNGTPAVEVARGSLTVVCVVIDEPTGTMKAEPLPEAFDRQIEVAPAEVT
jgi:YbgC/YbaW family acyl-CoA thioester hydrolase